MLVRIAVPASVFGPEVIFDAEARYAARLIFQALLGNAVVTCDSQDDFITTLLRNVEQAQGSSGQFLKIAAEEIVKNRKEKIIDLDTPVRGTPAERFQRAARKHRADVVICASEEDRRGLLGSLGERTEVCTLMDFAMSATEARRSTWQQSQNLSERTSEEAAELVGRAVMFADRLYVIDGYVGVAARSGRPDDVRRYAAGIVYVAEQWQKWRPRAAGRRADVVIVTMGGMVRGTGHVSPPVARPAIERAVFDCDRGRCVDKVEVIFKQDTDPAVFKDRFIKANMRCWLIRHGVQDLAALLDPPRDRGTVSLDPDCPNFRQDVARILDLPDVR